LDGVRPIRYRPDRLAIQASVDHLAVVEAHVEPMVLALGMGAKVSADVVVGRCMPRFYVPTPGWTGCSRTVIQVAAHLLLRSGLRETIRRAALIEADANPLQPLTGATEPE
jgi:hypothetical protein